jgi:hypothetical protein
VSLRRQVTVLTELPGSYVGGKWHAGTRQSQIIQASVQPAKVGAGADLEALPEGRRFSNAIKVYTTADLRVTNADTHTQPDLIVHDGFAYEIVSRAAYNSGVIDHKKYIAVQAMAYTSTADWIGGQMERP